MEFFKLFRFKFGSVAVQGDALEMAGRPPLFAGLIAGVVFVIFASVWVTQFKQLSLHGAGNVPDLMGKMFSLFWLMGWTLGVLFLALVTLILLFFRQVAFVDGRRLVNALQVGPFSLLAEYDVTRIKNLRIEEEAGGKTMRLVFEYDGLGNSLGNMMQPDAAERNLQRVLAAQAGKSEEAVAAPVFAPASVMPVPPQWTPPADLARPGLPLTSMVALVAANLLPLVMVLLGEWTLEQVILLFWAESAVIAFYTLLKMAVVERWWAIFPGLFFLGHFGGFMSIHLLFIYELFFHASSSGVGALEELARVFAPVQLALLGLLLSHGTSFAVNFVMHREYEGERVQRLMTAPYKRIVVMQLVLIFGGWMVMLLHDPAPALAMLIVFKIIADLRGHYAERKGLPGSDE